MTAEAKCFECGATVSYDTGFTMTGGLGDNSQDRIWCPEHTPNRGKGYTLADLEKWKRESQEQREADKLRRQTHVMDLMGPNVTASWPERTTSAGTQPDVRNA